MPEEKREQVDTLLEQLEVSHADICARPPDSLRCIHAGRAGACMPCTVPATWAPTLSCTAKPSLPCSLLDGWWEKAGVWAVC